MVRVAKTHIRFGHFEYLMHNKKSEFIPILLDHVIESYFPDLKESKDGYTDLFEKIVFLTAGLIAKWQAFGFAHGVMNTDNMSILGETFDFGPKIKSFPQDRHVVGIHYTMSKTKSLPFSNKTRR